MLFGPRFPRPRPQVSISQPGATGQAAAAAAVTFPQQQTSPSVQRRLRDEPGG